MGQARRTWLVKHANFTSDYEIVLMDVFTYDARWLPRTDVSTQCRASLSSCCVLILYIHTCCFRFFLASYAVIFFKFILIVFVNIISINILGFCFVFAHAYQGKKPPAINGECFRWNVSSSLPNWKLVCHNHF